MSTQQPANKKPNTNPTFIPNGVPVLIYLSEQELTAMQALAQLLHKQFKSQPQTQKFLKSADIREFVKFSTLTYYNMVVMKIRADEAQAKKQQQTQEVEDTSAGYM